MTRSDPPGRVLIRTAWFRVPPGIRDQIRPPSSLDRSGGHQRGETFAQFRVSRFTGDWHWPRSNGGRTSTTFGPPTSPRGGTTGTFDVRLPNQRRRRRYVHLVRGLIRANQHYRLTPRSIRVSRRRNRQMVRACQVVRISVTPLSRRQRTFVLSLSAATDHRTGCAPNAMPW